MSDQLNKIRTAAHEKLKKESEVVVEVQKPSSLQTAAVDYLSRKEEPHPLSSPKNINESVTEGKMNDLHMYIKQGKTAKEIGKLMGVDPKTIQKLMDAYDVKNESVDLDEAEGSIIIPKTAAPSTVAGLVSLSKKKGLKVTSQEKRKDGGTTIQLKGNQRVILDIQGAVASRKGYKTEETLDEREKSVRQLINPTKEVMVVKKNKVVVIDKKDQDKYIKQGWALAEKLDKDDEDSVGDVVKQLKKAVKAHQGQVKSLTKDMQDELQVKEWFKSKNIDVKVRELDESTQVYVPLGRRIPNEIREELITTQYGKMPEDVKNVKDINYGNFMENSITMNNDFWSKVLHGTKGE